ncbi:Hypothetical protein D9617_1g086310 [Elsinoe fawcettii]|nr:Hypothetical protein D9617_1g086310 [Elsinoe fawcettii]
MASLKREAAEPDLNEQNRKHQKLDSNDQGFQECYSKLTDMMDTMKKRAEDLVKDTEFFSAGLRRNVAKLREKGDVRQAGNQKICMLGPSGSGKSSLLNSLTHERNLSRTAACSDGCTSAVWEVTAGGEDQKKKYRAEIDYFDSQELEQMIKQYLDDYDEAREATDETRDNDTETRLRNSGRSFYRLVLTLFGHNADLADEDRIDSWLQNDYDQSTTTFKRFLHTECIKLVQQASGSSVGPLRSSFDFDNPVELRRCVQPLGSTQHGDPGQQHLWPLVKKIRISIADHPLLQNVILGDAPGIFDVNTTRADACREYLKQADYLFVVTNMLTRISSDSSIDRLLNDYHERFAGKIALVVTCTDLRVNTGDVKGFIDEVKKTEKANLVDRHAVLKEKIQVVKRSHRGQGRKDASKRALEPLNQELDELNLLLRIESTRSEFRRLRQVDIPMFFISNEAYWQHQTRSDMEEDEESDEEFDTQSPTLSATNTGVEELRKFVRGVPMISIYRTLDMCLNSFTAVAASLQAACETKPVEDVNALRIILDNFKAQLEVFTLNRAMTSDITTAFANHRRKRSWIAAGSSFVSIIGGWAPQSIRAGIRRVGVHTIKKVNHFNWNMRFIEPALPTLNSIFASLELSRTQRIALFERQLDARYQALKGQVSANKSLGWDAQSLDHILQPTLRVLNTHTAVFKDGITKGAKNIKLDTTKDSIRNYFVRCMQPHFDHMRGISGNGFREKVTRYLLDTISDDGRDIYKVWSDNIIAALQADISTPLAKLTSQVDAEAGNVCASLMNGGKREAQYQEIRTKTKMFSDMVMTTMPLAKGYLEMLKQETNKWKRTLGEKEQSQTPEVPK